VAAGGFLLLVLAAAAPGGLRDFCADRPGLGTPACTLDRGHVQLELGLADWTLERTPGSRTDTVLAGDLLARIGVADHAEIQLGWTAYGHVRERAGGRVSRQSGAGDLFVALRRNLLRPDGSGTTLAVMPYGTIPVGGSAIGAGEWSIGVKVPFGFALGDSVSLAFTPQLEAAADSDRHGRHLAFGSVAGIGVSLAGSVDASLEFSAMRDQDPAGHATETLAGASIAWQPGGSWQLDAGANVGLNRQSADIELYAGVSRRF
jgi:hypothetical protein